MLLCLVKHLMPNIFNATLELSKVNDEVSKVTFLKIHDVGMRNQGLKIEHTWVVMNHGTLYISATAIMQVTQ